MAMAKEPPRYVPAQRFVGMQVIDTKGTLVGNIKDVSVDFQNRSLAFRVTTKSRAELDVSWGDVQSVEDVVLLKKEVELPASTAEGAAAPVVIQPAVQAMVICTVCGTSAPSHAKFCPKCGNKLK